MCSIPLEDERVGKAEMARRYREWGVICHPCRGGAAGSGRNGIFKPREVLGTGCFECPVTDFVKQDEK